MRVLIARPTSSPVGTGAHTKARSNWLLRWSRNILLGFGLIALGYSGFMLLEAKLYQAFEARLFQQKLELDRAAPPLTGAEGPGHVVLAAVEGGTLGRIEIARIGLDAMIAEGVGEQTLRHAVGHIPSTPLPGQPGNVAIAGHRDTFFRVLRNVRQDDEITLTTLQGSYRYLVDTAHVVKPTDMQVLDDSEESILTLVTCYPFYFVGPAPNRFVVRAHRIPG